jgi:hypothetical protein
MQMKISTLFFAFFLVPSAFLFAQKDTLRYVVGRPIDENPLDSTDWNRAQLAYCDSIMQRKNVATFYMPTGNIKGEPILLYIDTVYAKNEAIQQATKDFLIDKYRSPQEAYFNLLYRNFPELEGLDHTEHQFNITAYRGKPTIIGVHSLPSQNFFDDMHACLDSLQQRFSSKNIKSLILSYGFVDEVQRFMEDKKDICKVIPYSSNFCTKHLMHNILYPYYIVIDSKGVIQHIEFLDNDTTLDLEHDTTLLRFYNMDNLNFNNIPIWERLSPALYKTE